MALCARARLPTEFGGAGGRALLSGLGYGAHSHREPISLPDAGGMSDLVALIKNWRHGLNCLRQNVDHADQHLTRTTQPRAHTSQLGRCREVSKNVSAGAGRC